MSKKKYQNAETKMKQLRRKSVWPSILFFFSFMMIAVLLVGMSVSALMMYMIETRYAEAHEQMKNIGGIIEEKIEEDTAVDFEFMHEEVSKLDNAPIGISIFDQNMNPMYSYGETFDVARIGAFSDDLDVNVFVSEDTMDNPADREQVGSTVRISFWELIDSFREKLFHQSSEEYILSKMNESIYEYRFWIKEELKQGDLLLFAEFEQSISMYDCLIVFVVVAVCMVIMAVLLLVCFLNAVHNIRAQHSILNLLRTDAVTQGNNELAFDTYAAKELTRSSRKKNAYAIVNFTMLKYHNYCSLYGTREGEKLLVAMHRCMEKFVGRGEACGRVNGANFLMLLKVNQGREELVLRVKEFVNSLPAEMKYNSSKKEGELVGLNFLKFQCGIYFVDSALNEEWAKRRNKKNLQVEQLCLKADMAKQSLPEEGGIAVYNHEMWEKELWEQKVEDRMQDALNKEEFQVYIQPKYHPSTEELVGGEALVRWISPEEGFVPPGKFIPIFEKTGFVTKLDDYMISHTAALQAKWLAEGKKIVPISVNVSRAHFAQPDLAEHIRDLVDAYPLPHKYIEIELTESAFFDDKNALLSTVRKLQEYDFEVSMDDFGSGYSSLNSLKDLPLDVLKLDAEFFRGDDFNTRGEIVVSEAIALAKKLEMKIVAEGVEKKEQVDFLASKECDMIQGYYFAKPMPAQEYSQRMSLK